MQIKPISILLSIVLLFSLISSASAQDQNQYPVYIVQSGDTLSSIADRFGVSLTDLINYNNITNANVVSVGSSLIIPGLQGLQGTLTTNVVQLGESLKSLTIKYQIGQDLLMKLNHITSPGEIYAGSSLILPLQSDTQNLVPVAKVDSSQTLLEIAALHQTTTWNLLDQNDDVNQFVVLPADLLYANSSDPNTKISAVDPKLNNVTISPLPLVQGDTYVITVDSPQGVSLQGSLNGMPLNFFTTEDKQQVALQGIYGEAEPGLAPFILSGKFADGSSFDFEQSILLVSGDYPEAEPLTVDPATIDPAVTQPEEDFIENLTSMATPIRYWSGMFKSPAVYYEFSAYYGERRTYNNGALKNFHTGVDFAGGMGLPISAPADGVVVYTGLLTVRGNATVINHGWGVYSAYFHQSEIDVKVGDVVKQGQVIGKVGNTGRVQDSSAFEGAGSHLHWELWVNGIQVDPLQWLDNQYP